MLKGNMDAQNDLLSQIAVSGLSNNGSTLILGAWDTTTSTYSSIEILPFGYQPGSGIQIKTYPDIAANTGTNNPADTNPQPEATPQPETIPQPYPVYQPGYPN